MPVNHAHPMAHMIQLSQMPNPSQLKTHTVTPLNVDVPSSLKCSRNPRANAHALARGVYNATSTVQDAHVRMRGKYKVSERDGANVSGYDWLAW